MKESFNKKELAVVKTAETKTDSIIRTLCWVYDLNFKYSYKYLKENEIFEKIYNFIENKEKFKYYFDKIIEYLDERDG